VTPQEEQLLNSLVERVNQTQLQEKDPDAEALLNRGLSANQDALYIMAQTVLVQNIALEQAKAQLAQAQQQIVQLQQQVQHPARATSFLGNLLGHHDAPPLPTYLPPQQQGYAPPPPPPPGYDPQYAQPQYGPAQYGPPQYIPAGQPSFMRGAMQTAAGVAAGALAFEGVEAVLHGLGGFGHPGIGMGGMGMGPGMMGGGMMGMGTERPIEENVVNNYYDQPGAGEHRETSGFDQNSFGQGGEVKHFHDSSDPSAGNQGSDAQFLNQSDQGGAQLTDASYNTTGDAGSGDDLADSDQGTIDSNDDNSIYDDGGMSSDDSGSSDDGGGYDDGGGGGF
jgi:hypothetical protein